MLRYKRTKGQTGSFLECYFNPTKPEEVILDISVHKTLTVHALFWPCCVFAIGVCMMVKACQLRRTQRKQLTLTKEVSFPEDWSDNKNQGGETKGSIGT